MAVSTVKEVIEQLQKLDPNEPIFDMWYVKADLATEILEQDVNGFDVDKDFSDEIFNTIFRLVWNDEYVWEKFNESVSDIIQDVCTRHVVEREKAASDQELWEG
jgi:hypothetical protein